VTPWYYGVVPVPSSNFHSGLGFSEVGFPSRDFVGFPMGFPSSEIAVSWEIPGNPMQGRKILYRWIKSARKIVL